MTYGDGLGDVNITALVAFHRAQKTLATLTAVQPPGRFGMLTLDGRKIVGFTEKPEGDGGWINGGFFVLSPRAIDYIAGDDTPWERAPLERLATEKQLSAYMHRGFWQPMDTFAIASTSKACGRAASRRGRSGRDGDRVGGTSRLRHRRHRLQGGLACDVASRARRRRARLLPAAPDLPQSVRARARRGRRPLARTRTCVTSPA